MEAGNMNNNTIKYDQYKSKKQIRKDHCNTVAAWVAFAATNPYF